MNIYAHSLYWDEETVLRKESNCMGLADDSPRKEEVID